MFYLRVYNCLAWAIKLRRKAHDLVVTWNRCLSPYRPVFPFRFSYNSLHHVFRAFFQLLFLSLLRDFNCSFPFSSTESLARLTKSSPHSARLKFNNYGFQEVIHVSSIIILLLIYKLQKNESMTFRPHNTLKPLKF